MKVRNLILLMLITLLSTSVTAQQVGRRMLIHQGGEVLERYVLPDNLDSITFVKSQIYTISVTSSDETKGTATASVYSVEEGGSVELTATPNSGYAFKNWTVNGIEASTQNSYTTTISENSEFVANFMENNENGYEFVDLGLSVRWATCNVGASNIEDSGNFFTWASTTKNTTTCAWSTNKYFMGENRVLKYCTDSNYGTIDNKTTLELEDDAANVYRGARWRTPTREEFQELIDHCSWIWGKYNGNYGYLVISRINGNSIFLPNDLYCYGSAQYNSPAKYWTSSLGLSSRSAYALDFITNDYNIGIGVTIKEYTRYAFGFYIRPVYEEVINDSIITNYYSVSVSVLDEATGSVTISSTQVKEGGVVSMTAIPDSAYVFKCWMDGNKQISDKNPYTTVVTSDIELVACFEKKTHLHPSGYNNYHAYVDLGLSVKWATCNVGATAPEEYGDRFAWGETITKDEYTSSNFNQTNFNSTNNYSILPEYNLLLSNDVAHIKWGGSWRVPSYDEFIELKNNCIWEWRTENGVNGYVITSKINGNSIFIPADITNKGFYWSNLRHASYRQTVYGLSFNSTSVTIDRSSYYYGGSVRAVCE